VVGPYALMRGLHNHLPAPGFGDDYYDILIEFAKLLASLTRGSRIPRSNGDLTGAFRFGR